MHNQDRLLDQDFYHQLTIIITAVNKMVCNRLKALLFVFLVIASLVEGRRSLGGKSLTSALFTKRQRFTPLMSPRGGARKVQQPCCSDSDLALAGKTAVSVGLEGAGLLGVIYAGNALAKKFSKKVAGLPIPNWVSLIFVIFSSSTVKSWVDGSLSVATSQVLSPTTTPGNPDWYKSLKKPWFNPPG